MTVMGEVSAQNFANLARSIFPKDKFFLPEEYLRAFNLRRDVPLSLHTYKKYVGIVYGSSYFPDLFRERKNSKEPYLYIVSSSGKDPSLRGFGDALVESDTKLTLQEMGRRAVDSVVGHHIISTNSLSSFVRRADGILKEGKWYKASSILRKYNMLGHRRIKVKTIASYLSLAFRRDLWKGLQRRKARGNMYEYRWIIESEVTETPPVTYQSAKFINSCVGCQKDNPVQASFCMYCGKGLGPIVRVIVQERVRELRFPPLNRIPGAGSAGESLLLDNIKEHVQDWVSENLVITVEIEGNNYISIVDVKGGHDGQTGGRVQHD